MSKVERNIAFIFPGPIYNPDMPNFKDRFELLSKYYKGEVYSWSCDKRFENYAMGTFVFRGLVNQSEGLFKKLKLAKHIIGCFYKYNKDNKVDVVICYDPLFSGILGCFIKLFFKVKLVIEINNSDIPYAVKISINNKFIGFIKYWLYKVIILVTCSCADQLKVLSQSLKEYISVGFRNKVSIFHDYVPTHFFDDERISYNKEILFIGFPFYRKGVDILINAFNGIKIRYPDFKLILIGHKLQDETKDILLKDNRQIEVRKPVDFIDLRKELLSCYCFVLPSREEGLPRVMIEAMACSKALIGTRVGGIPDLIDGNGFLLDSEDTMALSNALDKVMSDENLARKLGKKSREILDNKFSSEIYGEKFNNMISSLVGNE